MSKSRARIAVLTGACLSNNPRAFREAATLSRAGYEVRVLGCTTDRTLFEADCELARLHGFDFVSVLQPTKRAKGWLESIARRASTRLAADLYKRSGIESRWQLGQCVADLALHATETNADLYISHLEQGAWVGVRLMRAGARVGIDMEDWYSEDLPPESRKSRPIQLLRDLELQLLTTSKHASSTSRAMSQALSTEFGCIPPMVIYNALPSSDRVLIDGIRKDRGPGSIPTIHWFSQTIGPGRGLEDLFAALPLIKHEMEIHLRGNPVHGFNDFLARLVPNDWRERVKLHSLTSTTELTSRIAEHDIGFAGELPTIRSRDLTVTNKILYYLHAGLAVIASDTAGQREVASQVPDGVFLYPSGDAAGLAEKLNVLLGKPFFLRRAKEAAFEAGHRVFSWEQQESQLLASVERALSEPRSWNSNTISKRSRTNRVIAHQ